MAFFNDTYCHLCEIFITEEQWKKHLFSNRHLHREVSGNSPVYFPQRKLTKDENIIAEKASWKKSYATRKLKEVQEFWLTYFMMTTNMKDYFLEDNEEIRKVFRDTMEGQFEHDWYNNSFSKQLESGETDTLQQRIVWWMVVVDGRCPILNNVYDYSFAELFDLYRKTIDPEM